MNANPEFAASLEQDYKVYNWMYGNGETTGNPIVDDKGGKKTFNEYVSDMINPFLSAKSYYNATSSIQFNSASIKAINDASKKKMMLLRKKMLNYYLILIFLKILILQCLIYMKLLIILLKKQ